jgi:hypothetical protein
MVPRIVFFKQLAQTAGVHLYGLSLVTGQPRQLRQKCGWIIFAFMHAISQWL